MVLFYPLFWVLPFLFFCPISFNNSTIPRMSWLWGVFRSKSLAAVGATSAIFDLIVGFAVGVGNGMGLLSREIMEPKRRPITKISRRNCLLLVAFSVSSWSSLELSDFSPAPIFGTPSAIVSQSYLYIATIVNGVAVTLPIIFVPDFFERLAIV